jgi:hypothetical protein
LYSPDLESLARSCPPSNDQRGRRVGNVVQEKAIEIPHNHEAEKMVCGALLLNPKQWVLVAGHEDDIFYSAFPRRIAKAIGKLESAGDPVDISTVGQILTDNGGISDAEWLELSEILEKATTSAHIGFHVKILHDNWVRRKTMELTSDASTGKCDPAAVSILIHALQDLTKCNGTGKQIPPGLFLTPKDIESLQIVEREVMVDPWLKQGDINMVYGKAGIGKTFFVYGMLHAMCRGDSFGPWQCYGPVKTLYIDGELPLGDIQERLRQLEMISDATQYITFLSVNRMIDQNLGQINLAEEYWRNWLFDHIIAGEYKLVILDNLLSLAMSIGAVNTDEGWQPINQWLLSLRFHGVTTILVHHAGKPKKDGSIDQLGTSTRVANMNTVIALTHSANPEPGKMRFVVNFPKKRVALKDLHLIRQVELGMELDENGRCVWTTSIPAGDSKRNTIIKMFDRGYTQADICKRLDVDKAHVSRVIKKAKESEWLDKDGKLSPAGEKVVYVGEGVRCEVDQSTPEYEQGQLFQG